MNQYFLWLLRITFLLMVVMFVSCKSQQQSVQSTHNQVSTKSVNNIQQKEKLPNAVTEESIEEQKLNEFASKKSDLLCSLAELKRDFNNATNDSQKAAINGQIVQLKNQIAELDNAINDAFPDKDRISEINTMAENMSKDC